MNGRESLFAARLADVRANKNRKVTHEVFIGRVSQTPVHSIREDDRRGNFKSCLGLFSPNDCPICNEGAFRVS